MSRSGLQVIDDAGVELGMGNTAGHGVFRGNEHPILYKNIMGDHWRLSIGCNINFYRFSCSYHHQPSQANLRLPQRLVGLKPEERRRVPRPSEVYPPSEGGPPSPIVFLDRQVFSLPILHSKIHY